MPRPRKQRAPMRKKRAPRPTQNLARAVKTVLNRELETKYKFDYSGSIFPAINNFGSAGNNGHNSKIDNNTADIHALIPWIDNGTETFQRIGKSIEVRKLTADIDVSINAQYIQNNPGVSWNLYVVLYIWQHKLFKDYSTLSSQNSFAELLDIGDGNLTSFAGEAVYSKLPVNEDAYSLKKKMVFRLRTDGMVGGVNPATPLVVGANSAPFQKKFTVDLTRFVPKELKYSINHTGNQLIDSYPVNSSLAMSMGYYSASLDAIPTGDPPLIDVNYVTKIYYKDA